MQYKEQF